MADGGEQQVRLSFLRRKRQEEGQRLGVRRDAESQRLYRAIGPAPVLRETHVGCGQTR